MIQKNHPILTRLQKSKVLTALSVLGYILIPLSIVAYGFYTSTSPSPREISQGEFNGYPAVYNPVNYTSPGTEEPASQPVSRPKPRKVSQTTRKPTNKPQNSQVETATIETKKDKKPDHKPDDHQNSSENRSEINNLDKPDGDANQHPGDDNQREDTEEQSPTTEISL